MFNRSSLFKNIEKNTESIVESDFINFIKADLIDRLEPLKMTLPRIITIRDHENFISSRLEDKFKVQEVVKLNDEEMIEHQNGNFDMIIFPFGMHFTNEIQKFLKSAAHLLNDNGILVVNFAGGGSLSKLRNTLYNLENENKLPHAPHIIPLIKFDNITPLLQQAGFIENIIDMESFELEFDSPLELMKAIKRSGNSNILQSGVSYSIHKKMYLELKSNLPDKFIDEVNLITFLACKKKSSIKLKSKYLNL